MQVRKYVINRHPIPNQTQEKQLEDTQIAIGSQVAFGIEMEIKHVHLSVFVNKSHSSFVFQLKRRLKSEITFL